MTGRPSIGPAWLRSYRRADLPGDLTAGVTVAVMLIPQAMAYAVLAGLPPVVGLYAATAPLLVYALIGSSRQLAVGPVALVALLTFSGVSELAEPFTPAFVGLAALLALMVGVLQWALGLLRAGFLSNFLSHAVISGFTSAAAILIGVSQLRQLLGIEVDAGQPFHAMVTEVLRRLPEAHLPTVAVGGATLALLAVMRKSAPRLPAPLVAMAAATLAAWLLRLDEADVRLVGDVPAGLPPIALPVLELDAALALLPSALTIAFVGFLESIAIARSIASRERYKVDADRELQGLGLANVAGAFLQAFPVTGGLSRTAVNYRAGARTGLASMVTAGLVLLTLLALTPLFRYLPLAALAALVIVAVTDLIDVKELRRLRALKPVDAWTLLVTFGATLAVGIEHGIAAGVAFSLLVFIWRSAYPHTARLGYLRREDVFRNQERYPEVETYPRTLILRVDASLYFANMAFLEGYLRDALVDQPDLRRIILDLSGVNDMDAVAVETLEELIETLERQGVRVHMAAMKGPVRDITARAGWPERFGDRIAHLSVEQALERSAGDVAEGQALPRDTGG